MDKGGCLWLFVALGFWANLMFRLAEIEKAIKWRKP